jgi:hypothetical protein
MIRARFPLALAPLAALAACATQSAATVAPQAPGFLLGLWHGFIFPVAWVLSLFLPHVAVYAVPNNGGWYDFGYFLGIVVFGVGARKSHVVYRTRTVRERIVPGTHRVIREEEE